MPVPAFPGRNGSEIQNPSTPMRSQSLASDRNFDRDHGQYLADHYPPSLLGVRLTGFSGRARISLFFDQFDRILIGIGDHDMIVQIPGAPYKNKRFSTTPSTCSRSSGPNLGRKKITWSPILGINSNPPSSDRISTCIGSSSGRAAFRGRYCKFT